MTPQSRGPAFGQICALLALALCSCLRTTGLENYPRRVIDRPYVLPESVKSGSNYVGVERNGFGEAPRYYRYSWGPEGLQERGTGNGKSVIQTVLIPVPVGWRRSLLQTEADVIGYEASIGLSAQFDQQDTLFLIEPEVRFYGRHRLSRDLAWEAMGTVLTTLGSGKKGNGVPWAVGLQSGPLLQRGHVALRARAGIVWTHGPVGTVPYAAGSGWIYRVTERGDYEYEPSIAPPVVPLSMQMVWSASRRLDVIVDVGHYSIGYRRGFSATVARLTGRLHWGEAEKTIHANVGAALAARVKHFGQNRHADSDRAGF